MKDGSPFASSASTTVLYTAFKQVMTQGTSLKIPAMNVFRRGKHLLKRTKIKETMLNYKA